GPPPARDLSGRCILPVARPRARGRSSIQPSAASFLVLLALLAAMHHVVVLRRRRVLLVVLADDGLARLVLVVSSVERGLLLHGRVPLPAVLALIGRHWSGGRHVSAIHLVPVLMLLGPGGAPMLGPPRRSGRRPPVKVGRRPPVVPDRHLENEGGHDLRIDQRPRSVVPGARVPVVVLVDPVHAVVEEEVAVDAGRVVHR